MNKMICRLLIFDNSFIEFNFSNPDQMHGQKWSKWPFFLNQCHHWIKCSTLNKIICKLLLFNNAQEISMFWPSLTKCVVKLGQNRHYPKNIWHYWIQWSIWCKIIGRIFMFHYYFIYFHFSTIPDHMPGQMWSEWPFSEKLMTPLDSVVNLV